VAGVYALDDTGAPANNVKVEAGAIVPAGPGFPGTTKTVAKSAIPAGTDYPISFDANGATITLVRVNNALNLANNTDYVYNATTKTFTIKASRVTALKNSAATSNVVITAGGVDYTLSLTV
jgi:hypothetical protein